uniref:HECT domain-containing protein n=2 Tax=Nothobranchius korthausae TaxID=1143690 RepID=A0A1A8EKA7_9TELE
MEKKGEMIRAIVLHATMQRTPMLKELREGLDLYKFATVLKEETEHCRGLFVADNNDKVDSHYIVSHLDPQMSDKGSIKHIKEVKILNYFQDFLIELEDNQEDGGKDQLTVPKVLQWFTGQSHRHLLLSERQRFKITVCFERMPKHSLCFPLVSACSHTVTFPTAHQCTYEFKVNLATAITCGKEFHMI